MSSLGPSSSWRPTAYGSGKCPASHVLCEVAGVGAPSLRRTERSLGPRSPRRRGRACWACPLPAPRSPGASFWQLCHLLAFLGSGPWGCRGELQPALFCQVFNTLGGLHGASPCPSWACSLFCLQGAPIWAPDLLPWALFWAVAALSSAPCLASTPVGPSSLDGFPFPLLLEHLTKDLGGPSSPAWGTWRPEGGRGGRAHSPASQPLVGFAAGLPGAWTGRGASVSCLGA